MEPKDLAYKFSEKVSAALVESDRQKAVSQEKRTDRLDDADHCKRAMAENVMPFLSELKDAFPKDQVSLSSQIDLQDHRVVGASFKIGDGPVTTIWTAFGNVTVTQTGDSGSSKGISYIYPPDAEPYISNSGDLTRAKIAKLVEMIIDNS